MIEQSFGKGSRIIGENDNLYIVTNTPNTTLHDIFNHATIIDANGKQLTKTLPIGTLIGDDLDWKEIDTTYDKVVKNTETNIVDALIGFAIGDAFGVPMEFLSRNDIRKIKIKDMIGADTSIKLKSRWGETIPSGAWSDDTSMIVATLDSIIKNNGCINYYDIMNKFVLWYTKGEYTSYGKTFGVGNIVSKALIKYIQGIEPLKCGGIDIMDNGNGSLMRILPFSIYCIENALDEKETVQVISEGSSLTHGHDISKMSCYIYTEFLRNILKTKNPILSLEIIQKINYSNYFSEEAILAHKKLLKKNFKFIDDEKINSSGYVVDTLESVIYCIINSSSFEDAIEMAINMGYDTDTIGGITGSIAGILYSKKNIPERWLNCLKRKSYLEDLAYKFHMILKNNGKKNDYSMKI